jgi:hypothetical protein
MPPPHSLLPGILPALSGLLRGSVDGALKVALRRSLLPLARCDAPAVEEADAGTGAGVEVEEMAGAEEVDWRQSATLHAVTRVAEMAAGMLGLDALLPRAGAAAGTSGAGGDGGGDGDGGGFKLTSVEVRSAFADGEALRLLRASPASGVLLHSAARLRFLNATATLAIGPPRRRLRLSARLGLANVSLRLSLRARVRAGLWALRWRQAVRGACWVRELASLSLAELDIAAVRRSPRPAHRSP